MLHLDCCSAPSPHYYFEVCFACLAAIWLSDWNQSRLFGCFFPRSLTFTGKAIYHQDLKESCWGFHHAPYSRTYWEVGCASYWLTFLLQGRLKVLEPLESVTLELKCEIASNSRSERRSQHQKCLKRASIDLIHPLIRALKCHLNPPLECYHWSPHSFAWTDLCIQSGVDWVFCWY